MNKKVAFIAPIYPPHFLYGKRLLKSFKKSGLNRQSDLYLVFTNVEESKLFGKYEYKIILDKNTEKEFYRGSTHFPDAKKIFGCNYLKNNYEYLITLDCESQFIKDVNIYEVCCNFYDEKQLYGNKSNPGNMVIKNSLECFNNNETTDQNLDLYMWFNQPCIYKSDYLDDFFEKTCIYKDINHLKFGGGEYYAYMLYLIFYHKWMIKDIGVRTSCGFCESPGKDDIKKIENDNWKECKFLLATPFIYEMVKPYNDTVFLLIQLDTEKDFWSKFKWSIVKCYTLLWKIFHGMNIFGLK